MPFFLHHVVLWVRSSPRSVSPWPLPLVKRRLPLRLRKPRSRLHRGERLAGLRFERSVGRSARIQGFGGIWKTIGQVAGRCFPVEDGRSVAPRLSRWDPLYLSPTSFALRH